MLTSSAAIYVTVGVGGQGGSCSTNTDEGTLGTNGGSSSFGNILTATGGTGGGANNGPGGGGDGGYIIGE